MRATRQEPRNATRDVVQPVVQVLTALTAIAALLFTNQSLVATREQLQLNEQGQVADRFARAIDQLGQEGEENLSIRLGGIFSLERLMRDSPADAPTVVEVLCAFIRTHSAPPSSPSGEQMPLASPDVEAAAVVVGRRPRDDRIGPLDLAGAYLVGVNLSDADLASAGLGRANLAGAYLGGANLMFADLGFADLTGANLEYASLYGANLSHARLVDATAEAANLEGARLDGAQLHRAFLWRASLANVYLAEGADFSSAHVNDADLRGADLAGANLSEANLSGTNLSDADLSGANLSNATLARDDVEESLETLAANLKNTNLSGANLEGVTLRSGQLNEAILDAETRLPAAYVVPGEATNEDD